RDQSGMIEPNPGSPTYFESDHAHDLQVSQCCISVKSPTDQPEQQDGTSSMDNFCFDVTLGYRRVERPRREGGQS
ncbi:MAG TPA: hypothetical protein VEO01_02350, partial [Pseudonocardiaceae bacterium]|nr:hypothetical protein [Pseudonocardiaceae bacterium]